MNCNRAETLIQQALDGALTAAERQELDRHLSGCSACRHAWEEYHALARLAAGWAQRPAESEEGADAFAAGVLAQITAAPPTPALGTGYWLRPAAVLLAAGLLCVLSYLLAPAMSRTLLPPTDLLPQPQAVLAIPGWLQGILRSLPWDAVRAGTDFLNTLPLPSGIAVVLAAAVLANVLFGLQAVRQSRRRLAP